jgi:LPS-assembly protein
MRKITIICILFCISALLFSYDAGAEELLNKGGISIWADLLSNDNENDVYHARGNVMVLWNGMILVADTVTLSETTKVAVAEGGVRLVKGGDVLYCDRITMNMETEKGEVINGKLFSRKSNFHIQGEKIEKVGEDQYWLDHGTFTVCDSEIPSWKFTADDMDVTLEGFAVGKNAVFYVKDIPLLYTPYMLFPVKRERQSGFLIPHFSNSRKKGFNFDIPYYWAISPSQEALIALDVQTKRGAGFSIDYNYLRPKESLGNSHGYFIYDFDKGKVRGNFSVQQQEWFPPSFALKSDINLVTNRNFYRDFVDTSGDYNRQILDSSISLTKNWQNYSLAGETRYVDDLDATSNDGTLQKLPDIGFTAIRQRINGIPLYFGLDSMFVNFYHEDGVRGQRLDLHPVAAVYLPISDGIDFSAWGGYRERLYNAYSGETGNGSRGIGVVDAGARVSASLERVYDSGWGSMRKLRHVLVPEVDYNFVEERGQDDLPFFDFNDRVLGKSMVSWSIINFLTGKFQEDDATPDYRDLLYLRLSQGYQMSGPAQDPITKTPRDQLAMVDEGRRLTDIRIEANLAPIKGLSIFTDSRYNTHRTQFSSAAAGFEMNDGKGDSASLSYRFAQEEVEYLEGKVGLAIAKPFYFNYSGRYSFDRAGFLEDSYALEYRHQCWSVQLRYTERPATRDHAFMITFTLAGIGPLGKYKAF